uniref:Uncharacterized protein n=1 Tax=Cucumis melo TaxID=3656 RepID=A0A9I9EBQ2_CUCME
MSGKENLKESQHDLILILLIGKTEKGISRQQSESIVCNDQTINSIIQENELTTKITKAPRIAKT